MKIAIIEPYYTGSHAEWTEDLATHSDHTIKIFKLKGSFWKWRMHGGAVTLSRKFLTSSFKPDLILASDMLDLSSFLALTRRKTHSIPTAVYFHENQLVYPWSPNDRDVLNKRDKHYCFINYISALTADRIYFNSQYHLDSFLDALPKLLNFFPDHNELSTVDIIRQKSEVLYLGLDLIKFDHHQVNDHNKVPLILWNHRWEYDKNPEDFFDALFSLADRGLNFEVAILGESHKNISSIFHKASKYLHERVVHFGFVEKFEDYAKWLWRADILPVTSNQDFFGASIIQALNCGCFPLLPKRLTYPELIPEEYHNQLLYNNLEDLISRLEQAIQNIEETRTHDFSFIAKKFCWSQLTSKYDQAFTKLKDNFPLLA